jgi:hypothetical protein
MTIAKREKTKQQTIICKILHKKTNIETGRGLNSGDPDGLPVPVPLVVPVVLLLCNKP